MSHDPLADYDPLDDDYRDQLATIGKGVASLVPLFGGPLAEIVGKAIPNQRADRIATYMRNLSSRLDQLSETVQKSISESAAKIDLIEEGGFQSARAISRERIELIAEAVAKGLSADEADVIRRRRLLVMLGELDEDELALLKAYGRSYAGQDRQAFESINRPAPVHLRSSIEERERERLYETGKEHLLRLELLKRNYGQVNRGATPEFDPRLGDFKHRVEISYLGRLLLKEIGAPTPFDEARQDQTSIPGEDR